MDQNMNYGAYWGMTAATFTQGAAQAISPLAEEGLARLAFLVEERRELGLLVGEPGMGKSTLLRRFAKRLARRGVTVVHLSLLGRQSYETLWSLGQRIGARPGGGEPLAALWGAIESRLGELALDRAQVAILFDDFDGAVGDVVTVAGRLLTLAHRHPKLVTLVLSASPENLHRLGGRVAQQAHLRIDLDAWTAEETAEFLQRAVANAGGKTFPFAAEAIERLHRLTHGLPGRICKIADLALMAGAAEKQKSIGGDLIDGVFSEFAQLSAA